MGRRKTVKLQFPVKVRRYLDDLVKLGIYGDTIEEVVEFMLCKAIEDRVGNGILKLRRK